MKTSLAGLDGNRENRSNVFILRSLQDNTHRLTLSMRPDEAYTEKKAKEEEEKLRRKIQALSDSDREEIYVKGTSGP